MTIEIILSNENGDVVSSTTKRSYDEAVKEMLRLKPLIKGLEMGETGILICTGCGGEYLWGEDARVDASLICTECANNIG